MFREMIYDFDAIDLDDCKVFATLQEETLGILLRDERRETKDMEIQKNRVPISRGHGLLIEATHRRAHTRAAMTACSQRLVTRAAGVDEGHWFGVNATVRSVPLRG